MAEKKISLDLEINKGNTDKTVKSIKTELREAKEEAIALARKFGEFSPEAQKAAAKLAGLKDEMGDLNQAVQGLNPDKFARLATLTNGVVRGFQAAQGAMALFGKSGEDVEKAILKLQAVMALADGIQGVLDARKSFSALANQIIGPVIGAFKKMGTAMRGLVAASGIGLLVVALGAIVAYWDDIKEALSGVSKEQKQLNELAKQNLDINIEAAKNSATERTNLERLYKVSTDLKISAKERKTAVEELQATYPLTFSNFTAEEIALGKAKTGYDNLSESILASALVKARTGLLDKKAQEFAEQEILDLEKVAKKKGVLAKQEADLATQKNKRFAKDLTDAIVQGKADLKVYEDGMAAKKVAFEKSNLALLVTKDIETAKLVVKEKEEVEKIKAIKAKEISDAKKTQEEIDIAKNEANDERLRVLINRRDKEVATQKNLAKILKEVQEESIKSDKEIKLRQAKDVDEFNQTAIKGVEDRNNKVDELNKKHKEDQLAKQKAYEENLQSLKSQAVTAGFELLRALNQEGDNATEAAQKKAFERNKAMAIAETVITTYQAAALAYKNGLQTGDVTQTTSILGAAVAVAQGLAKLVIIKKQTFKGSSSSSTTSSGGGGGSVGIQAPQTGFTQIRTPNQNPNNPQQKQPPIKVFVTQKDIQDANNTADRITSKAVVK
jgi:hypothetical protein